MTTSIVTGAAGFVGSNLVDHLLERGDEVRGVDNYRTGHPANLEQAREESKFTFFERDLATDDVVDVLDGADIVFHQAAVPSVPRSVDDPLTTTEANCLGTTNLLVAARDADVDVVVVASSSSVYGSGGELPKRVDHPANPESPYALSKFWTERLAVQFSTFYDLDTVALRYFNVFGPRQDPASDYAAVIPKFIDLMFDGRRPPIYGDGEQSRDFTYIENVVQANVQAAEADDAGEVFNVACGERITINELVEELNEVLGTDIEPTHEDPRPGDVRHSLAAIDRTREEIGYEPAVDLKEGLERTAAWLREQ